MLDIKVRPVKGMDAVTYLDPGALTSPLSYVRHPPLYTFKLKPSRLVVLMCACRWSCRNSNYALQVLGPLINNLQQLGYVYNKNLLAAGVRYSHSSARSRF